MRWFVGVGVVCCLSPIDRGDPWVLVLVLVCMGGARRIFCGVRHGLDFTSEEGLRCALHVDGRNRNIVRFLYRCGSIADIYLVAGVLCVPAVAAVHSPNGQQDTIFCKQNLR